MRSFASTATARGIVAGFSESSTPEPTVGLRFAARSLRGSALRETAEASDAGTEMSDAEPGNGADGSDGAVAAAASALDPGVSATAAGTARTSSCAGAGGGGGAGEGAGGGGVGSGAGAVCAESLGITAGVGTVTTTLGRAAAVEAAGGAEAAVGFAAHALCDGPELAGAVLELALGASAGAAAVVEPGAGEAVADVPAFEVALEHTG